MRRGAIGLMFIVALVSCSKSAAPPGRVHVVATTTMIGDLISNVVGNEATVEVLMPLGADPHDFQLSARQAASLASADMFVMNGLGLEADFDDIVEVAISQGVRVIQLGPLVEPLPYPKTEVGADDVEDGFDPHFWMDPLRIAEASGLIADALEEMHPGHGWRAHAQAYQRELSTADDQIIGILSQVPMDRRLLVSNHESLGYFASRYGFKIIGVVIPGTTTLSEPSSAELAALVATMRTNQVKVIFAETTEPTVLAEAISAEIPDSRVVELFSGSLGGPGSGAETLIDMLVTNATLIADALSK